MAAQTCPACCGSTRAMEAWRSTGACLDQVRGWLCLAVPLMCWPASTWLQVAKTGSDRQWAHVRRAGHCCSSSFAPCLQAGTSSARPAPCLPTQSAIAKRQVHSIRLHGLAARSTVSPGLTAYSIQAPPALPAPCPLQNPENRHIKTIANMAFAARINGPHDTIYAQGYETGERAVVLLPLMELPPQRCCPPLPRCT